MLFKVENIKWDCDGEDPTNFNLPITSARIESDSVEDVIDDLSDEYGFLIESVESIYCYQLVDDKGNLDWVAVSNK